MYICICVYIHLYMYLEMLVAYAPSASHQLVSAAAMRPALSKVC